VTAAAPATGTPAGALWRTPGLRALLTASTTARLANESARVAMVLLVLDRTGSASLAGGLVAAATLPSLVTGPLLGAWLDRTAHRRVAFVANQLLLLLTMLGLLLVGETTPALLVLGLGAAAGLTSPVLTGGFTGLLAPLVPAADLRRAYGAEATSYNTAAVAGPALAGALAGLVDPAAAVVASGALSAVALLAVLRVPMPRPETVPEGGVLRAVAAGVRHLASHPRLRAITLATTASFGGMGALPVVLPLLASEELGAGPAVAGALLSCFAVGALAGSLAVAARTPRTGPLRSALYGIAGLGVVFGGIALAPSLPVAVVLVTVAGALEGPVFAATLTVRELHTPAWMRTQVVTTAASLKFAAFAAGSATAGAVAATHGARWGASVLAGAQVLALLLAALTLRTSARG
jgi:MFS family permease